MIKPGKPLPVPTTQTTEEQFYHAFANTRPGFHFFLRGGKFYKGKVERVGRYSIRVSTVEPEIRHALIYKSAIISVEPLPMEKTNNG